MTPSPSPPDPALVRRILADFERRRARGETINLDEFIARNPHMAPALREAYQLLHGLRAEPPQPSSSPVPIAAIPFGQVGKPIVLFPVETGPERQPRQNQRKHVILGAAIGGGLILTALLVAWLVSGEPATDSQPNDNTKQKDPQPNDNTKPKGQHPDPIVCAGFTADGQRAVVVGSFGNVQIWEVGTGKVTTVETVKDQPPRGAGNRPTPNISILSSGSSHFAYIAHGRLRIRDCSTGEDFAQCRVPDETQNIMAVYQKKALLQLRDGLAVLDTLTGQVEQSLNAPVDVWGWRNWTRGAFSADGRRILVATSTQFGLWDARTGQLLQRMGGHLHPVTAVALSPDGRRVLSADAVSVERVKWVNSWLTMKLWDAETGKEIDSLDVGDPLPVAAFPEQGAADLALSADGRRVLTTHANGEVALWDLDRKTVLRLAEPSHRKARCVALSPDARHGLVAWDDRSVQMLEFPEAAAEIGKPIAELRRTQPAAVQEPQLNSSVTLGRVRDTNARLALSADGKTVFASDGRMLRMWELPSGRELRPCPQLGGIGEMAVSSDGRLALTTGGGHANENKALALYDVRSSRLVRDWRSGDDGARLIDLAPDGSRAVAVFGGFVREVRVWDTKTGDLVWERKLDSPGPTTFTPDSRHLLSLEGARLVLRDASNGREVRAFGDFIESVREVRAGSIGTLALTSGRFADVWDFQEGKHIGRAPCEGAAALVGDGGWVLIADGREQRLRLVNVREGTEFKDFAPKCSSLVSTLVVTPDGKYALGTDGSFDVTLWRLPELPAAGPARVPVVYRLPTPTDLWVRDAAVTPDGATVLTVGDIEHRDASNRAVQPPGGALRVWDPVTGKERRCIRIDGESILAVAVRPDGRRALTASFLVKRDEPGGPARVRLWDLETGKELRRLDDAPSDAAWLGFSSDGRRALAAGRLGTIRIWDTENGNELGQVSLEKEMPVRVIFLRDGKRALVQIAAGMAKKDVDNLRLWDLEKGKEIKRYTGPDTYPAGQIALADDGQRVLVAGVFQIELLDLETGHRERLATAISGFTSPHALSGDGSKAIVPTNDRSQPVCCLSTDSAKELARLRLPPGNEHFGAHRIGNSSDARVIVVVGNGQAWLWQPFR